jgi:hypothetical protein
VVAELDPDAFSGRGVLILRFACASCAFVVDTARPYIGQLLLEKQIVKVQAKILLDYGIA